MAYDGHPCAMSYVSYAVWLLCLGQGYKSLNGKLYSYHNLFEEEVWVNGWTQVIASSDSWGWSHSCECLMSRIPKRTSLWVICWCFMHQSCTATLVVPLHQCRKDWCGCVAGRVGSWSVCLKRPFLPEEQVFISTEPLGWGIYRGKEQPSSSPTIKSEVFTISLAPEIESKSKWFRNHSLMCWVFCLLGFFSSMISAAISRLQKSFASKVQ